MTLVLGWLLVGFGVIGLLHGAKRLSRACGEDPALEEAFAKHGGHRHVWKEPDLTVIDGRGDREWARACLAQARIEEMERKAARAARRA